MVLYHFSIWPFAGGFVGVDVFFVISGYVITLTLQRDLAAGQFSIARFYTRRIKRILPALAVVIAASLAAGAVLLFPVDLANLGQQSAYAIAGLSNFYFLANTGGYFDRGADFLPLLHTWSLGVEEQFYLFWPLILWGLSRRGQTAVLIGLALIITLSFAAAVWLVPRDQPLAFYMLPTRAWELAAGAALVFLPPLRLRLLAELASIVGLALVAYGVFALRATSPFPGINAVAPCAGAVLLIWSRGALLHRVLSWRPIVFVGLISYSLYLWHWPVLVFFRAWANDARPTLSESHWLIEMAFVLAIASYYLIEQPIRRGAWPAPRVLAGGAVAIVLFAGAGLAVSVNGGLPDRLSAADQKIAAWLDYTRERVDDLQCEFSQNSRDLEIDPVCTAGVPGKPNVLLLGDSHMGHFVEALQQAFPEVHFSRLIANGCRPLQPAAGAAHCVSLVNAAYNEHIPNGGFDAVVLSGQWRTGKFDLLAASVEKIKRFTPRVVVLGQTMEYRYALPSLLVGNGPPRRAVSSTTASLYNEMKAADDQLRALANGGEYWSVLDAVCPASNCTTMAGEDPVEYDGSHFTPAGARLVVSRLKAAGLRF